ncbi:PH domain-containing protein [Chakrabartyella piscis]|uniref:PH domain-containing protein n=1 Tax=Chakrabartyella piscis TaxID=2918914 RepID=UPI002958C550|nr:PH domain-containing protein [Chakrabartyella piscis]
MQMTEKKRWVFFGLPFTFTTYLIEDEMLTITEGIFNRKENSCYMYKVTDVELKRSFGERIFGLGTVICYTGDVTHPTLSLQHIKNSKLVKTTLLEVSEAHRIKRRTVNMQNIGMDDMNIDLD